jgi:two-component system response regulator VicR
MGEKILVVDDEEPIRELLRNLLEKEGYEAILASDGEEAVRLTESENPDLIILDMIMPRLDGINACVALKASGKTRTIPIIVMTGFMELIGVAVNAGVDDVVVKPISLAELMVRVKAMLKVCHLENDLKRAMAYTHELRESSFRSKEPRS